MEAPGKDEAVEGMSKLQLMVVEKTSKLLLAGGGNVGRLMFLDVFNFSIKKV